MYIIMISIISLHSIRQAGLPFSTETSLSSQPAI